MERYCKIIELEELGLQVLLRKDYDSDEDKFSLVLHSDVEGVYLNTTFVYSNEEERDLQFDRF